MTTTGYSIYGLSTDSPKANTSFKTKQGLPYTLLSDPQGTLIEAIGLRNSLKRTKRGIFVINKQAKVEVVFAGVGKILSRVYDNCSPADLRIKGPAATVNKARDLVHEDSRRGGAGEEPEVN